MCVCVSLREQVHDRDYVSSFCVTSVSHRLSRQARDLLVGLQFFIVPLLCFTAVT